MGKKYPRSEAEHLAKLNSQVPSYISWDLEDPKAREIALLAMGQSVASYQAVATHGARTRNFQSLAPKMDGKPGLLWSDYDYFRPEEAVPTKFVDILTASNNAYRQVGLIRNVIDLMGDFACQGIRLVHPNKRIEKFYEVWWERVHGKNVSERFLNYLFRLGNDVIRMQTAKINKPRRERMMKSLAVDIDIINQKQFQKGEIPWQYTFLDPRNIEVIGGPLANFIGDKQYALKLSQSLKRFISANRNSPKVIQLLGQLPREVRKSLDNFGDSFPLPSDQTFVFHYRKDDWETWALPLVYACLDDITTLRKLKLADRAALDGATSKVRVWKLGNIEAKLAPNPAAAATLADILGSSVGGGTVDIVWGPDIELIESNTDAHNFLGEGKYKPTLMNIYQCMGIPPTLTGTFGAAGTTNNLLSLKTLTERLKYARGMLLEFWRFQVRLVQEGMGFRFPAEIEFDFLNLDDPATINQLLINLADRSIISDEFIHRHIGANTDMERIRMRREGVDRDKGKLPMKASPYHEPEQEHGLKKIFAQTGTVTPSEVGIELEDRKKGEKNALEMRTPVQGSEPKKSGTGTPGRPKGKPDTVPRKTKRFTPKIRARMHLWAKASFDSIAEMIKDGILTTFDKRNLRSLNKEEFNQTEQLKFELLCGLEPFQDVSSVIINDLIMNLDSTTTLHDEFSSWLEDLKAAFIEFDKTLTIDHIRETRASFYVNLKEIENG